MRPTFVYDGDCSFCTTCAQFIERRIPSHARVVPWQFADLGALGLTQAQAEEAVQWVAADGTVAAGPDAIALLLRDAGRIWEVPGRALQYAPVRFGAWPAYRWVSRHRHLLPGGTAACSLPQAQRDALAGNRRGPDIVHGGMRFARLTPAIVLLATLAGALPADSLAPVPLLTAGGVTRQPPDAGAPVPAVAASIAGLGYRMRTLADQGNWIASPLSVGYALAMVRAGAGPDTAAAIDRTFGFPATGLDAAFNSVTGRIATDPVPRRHTSDRPTVCISNGLFVQRGLPVGQPFLRTLASAYGTGVHPVDFATNDAGRAINAWVRRQTADKIKKAFEPETQPGAVLVLANTVYLHADWATPFDRTASEPFAGAGDVPTMTQIATLPYASGPGWQAVELPYAHSDLAMRILIPAGGDDPAELLRPETMSRVGAALRPTRLELHLPKWTTSSSADLRRLGPPELFGAAAELDGILPGAQITQAKHQAYIAVDEKGTEAAAATTVVMAVSAESAPSTVVRADRPFAFAIVHRPTNIPLFVGRLTSP